jgi:ribose 1,5-bisphosphokinase
VFVRRTITRPAGDSSEDNFSVDEAEFQRLADSGAFALSWSAHGLRYGLPSEIDDAIASGRVVVANVSRTILPELKARYSRVVAIAISADPAIVHDRLTGRGREAPKEIRQRSERVVTASGSDWMDIRNSGPIAEAGVVLVGILSAAGGRDK